MLVPAKNESVYLRQKLKRRRGQHVIFVSRPRDEMWSFVTVLCGQM